MKYPILSRIEQDKVFTLRVSGERGGDAKFIITEGFEGFYDFLMSKDELLGLAKEIEEFVAHNT